VRERERERARRVFSWGACVGVAMEEQFAEFRVELDEIGSDLNSFIRLMQAVLMPIHHFSFPCTNFFSFPFFFCISLLLLRVYIYIYIYI
jgi:hypothetical protein